MKKTTLETGPGNEPSRRGKRGQERGTKDVWEAPGCCGGPALRGVIRP